MGVPSLQWLRGIGNARLSAQVLEHLLMVKGVITPNHTISTKYRL